MGDNEREQLACINVKHDVIIDITKANDLNSTVAARDSKKRKRPLARDAGFSD